MRTTIFPYFNREEVRMSTVPKSSMFFALLTSLVALTACSGGGGGGGNGGPLPTPRPTISVSEITGGMPQQGYLKEDYSNAGDSGGLEATLKNGGLTAEFDNGKPTTELRTRDSLRNSNLPNSLNTALQKQSWSSGWARWQRVPPTSLTYLPSFGQAFRSIN